MTENEKEPNTDATAGYDSPGEYLEQELGITVPPYLAESESLQAIAQTFAGFDRRIGRLESRLDDLLEDLGRAYDRIDELEAELGEQPVQEGDDGS